MVMEYNPEGELFDQVVKESEEETSFYPIFKENAKEGELFDQVIMMSKVNVMLSPRGAFTSKKAL